MTDEFPHQTASNTEGVSISWKPYTHDDVIKWKYFPRYWPFVRGIRQSSSNSPHKGQWCGALIFYLICTWASDGWVNNLDAGDLRRYRAHYDVSEIMYICQVVLFSYLCICLRGSFEINTKFNSHGILRFKVRYVVYLNCASIRKTANKTMVG